MNESVVLAGACNPSMWRQSQKDEELKPTWATY